MKKRIKDMTIAELEKEARRRFLVLEITLMPKRDSK